MNKSQDILVSVVLPVYNGADYLKESMESILSQTYKNFELIIINDGSTDNSADIIRQFNDPRICFCNQENQGLAATLNRAIKISTGKYLARQDQDDISLPQRFEKQVEFLENHPDYGMVGTWASIINTDGKNQDRAHKHPPENLILKFELLFNNPFVHSSMMIRKIVFEKVGLYTTDKSRQPPEDYELWSRIAREFKVANIPEILHIYREVPSSMSRDGMNPFLNRVINISSENIAWLTGNDRPDQNCINCASLVNGANHRLSQRTSYTAISRLLYVASEKLSESAGADRNTLKDHVRDRVQSIRLSCLTHRYGKILGRLINHLYR